MSRLCLAVPLLWLLAACGSAAGSQPGSSSGGEPALATSSTGPLVTDESTVKQTIKGRKPTVLLFMATGCSSCAAQASALASAAGGQSGVNLVGVDLSGADDPAALRSFVIDAQLGSLPITWTVDRDGSLDQQYQVQALDEMVGLVGGAVRFHDAAATDTAQLRQQIADLR